MGNSHNGVLQLTFLMYPCEESPGRIVAHCLELDIVAEEASTPKAILLLKDLVDDLLQSAVEDNTLDKVIRPAPQEYWGMLARAEKYMPTKEVRAHHIQAGPVDRVGYAFASS